MFKLIFVFKCLIVLVTSNPLQGLQSYPVVYQQNYVNHDQPIVTHMFDAYPQIRQSTWPIYQNIPVTYQDASNGYYDKLLLNSIPNTYLDGNSRLYYNQNSIDGVQYTAYPSNIMPNILNNYVNIPQEYLRNQCVDTGRQMYVPTELTVPFQESQHLQAANQFNSNLNYNNEIQEVERTNKNSCKKRKSHHCKKGRDREENLDKTVKRKSSSRNYKGKNNIDNHHLSAADEICSVKSTQELNTINNSGDANESSRTNKKSRQKNISDKKQKTNRRSKCKELDAIEENKTQIRQNVKPLSEHNTLNQDFADCFDINENCIDLECRRTRNNYNNNPSQMFQQFPNMPKEFNSNIASYLNSFMPNQNFNTDFFTANSNFPYNFDYMNQIAQYTNSNPSVPDKKRKNRRRKKKSKSNRTATNNNENSSKNQQNEENYKLVEPLPNQSVEIEKSTKPRQNVPQNDDIVLEKDLSVNNITTEIIPDKVDEDHIEVILEPTSIVIDDIQNENLHNLPGSQEYTVNAYENDIFDDYYPDFTSDNIYMSKEDQNFHDRHFYSADSVMSRERRTYEPSTRDNHKANKIETFVSDESIDKTIKMERKITSTEDVNFKTPPGLDFPDFKTEMINKDKFSPRNDKTSSYSKVKSMESKSDKNIDNTVETVYARSKVVKYGVPELEQQSNKKQEEFKHTGKFKNDENTTIVLAKSLNYPVYK